MKFYRKLFSTIFITLMLVAALAGCKERFDCSGYVKSMLDATYKGEFDSYERITKTTKGTLEKDYKDFISHEADIWLQYCGISANNTVPEDIKEQITQLITELYKQTSYSVKEADKNGNVELTIEPLNIYNAVRRECERFNTEFKERNENYEFSNYSDEAFTRAYLEPIIEIFRKHIESAPHQESVIVTVQVTPDDSGRYGISDDDLAILTSTIINYAISN